MPRLKGSGKLGPTRSTRLPVALDRWFGERLELKRDVCASELLIALIHGGLRLRDGYMAVHLAALERYSLAGTQEAYDVYVQCLRDTFGSEYVRHVEQWMRADKPF